MKKTESTTLEFRARFTYNREDGDLWPDLETVKGYRTRTYQFRPQWIHVTVLRTRQGLSIRLGVTGKQLLKSGATGAATQSQVWTTGRRTPEELSYWELPEWIVAIVKDDVKQAVERDDLSLPVAPLAAVRAI